AAPGTWTYSVTDDNGCVATTSSVTLTEPAKVQVSTSSTVDSCGVGQGSVSATTTGGVAPYTYLWSNSSTSATASGVTPGNYTVTVTDANGCTGTATATVIQTVTPLGATGSIVGAPGACRSTTGVYSIPAVTGAIGYTWTLPTGATGSSNSNSITVTFSSSYSGGFICVTPYSTCGSGDNACLNVPALTVKPAMPGAISFTSACGPTIVTCSVAPVANATSYNWSVSSTLVSIISGQGTNSIQVSVPAGFTNSQVFVSASNCRGTSGDRYGNMYGLAVVSTGLTGPIYVCSSTTANYSVGAATAATGYSWSITGNASVVSSSANTCVVSTGANWSGGVLTVTTSSACGTTTRSYTLYRTPLQPGGITGPSTNLCVTSGTQSVSYSIAAVAGASSYSWTVPAGMSITGNSTGTSINVSITSSFVSGNVTVSAVNNCGPSTARSLFVTNKTAAPAAITGPTSVCQTQSGVAYSVAPVANATGYTWSTTFGAGIVGAGVNATVDFTTSTSSFVTLTVNALNACGASAPTRQSISVNSACRDAQSAVTDLSMTLFPNPTSGKFTLNFQAENAGRYQVMVHDLVGKSVIDSELMSDSGLNSMEIDLSNVVKGIYLVSLRSQDGNVETMRLIVE
ncbi:MAG: T9SS type A sorting domain-containing protein, partial [Bacteroidota bacterium]